MSNETLLYICGIVLALSAVTTCFVGLKFPEFPGKAMPIVVLWFAIFVVGSTTFAVLHAKDEDKAKAAELQKAGKEAEEEGEQAPAEGETKEGEEAEEAEGEIEGEPGEGREAESETGEAMEGEESEAMEGEESAEAAAGGDPAAGEMVFTENCSICHGSDGHGGNGGPDLRTMPLAKTEEGAIQQVTNGGGGMPAFGEQLSEEEIADVAAYVSQKIVGEG